MKYELVLGLPIAPLLSLVSENEFWNWRILWMEQTLDLERLGITVSFNLNCVHFLQALDLEFNYCRQFNV